MPKIYRNGLFLFTRDLRIEDNVGLNMAGGTCDNVYTVFIFTPEQVSDNPFKSENAVQFMIESLKSLEKSIKNKGGQLIILYGKPENELLKLIKELNIEAVFMSKEVTKYGKDRFSKFAKVCKSLEVCLSQWNDFYLIEPGTIFGSSGKPYVKFSPYYKKIIEDTKLSFREPITSRKINFKKAQISNEISLTSAMSRFGGKGSEHRLVHGGREEALKKLKSIGSRVSEYEATRNDLEDQTTHLSAYIKFGCISVRESYVAFKEKLDKKASTSLIRQLIWRDFYAQVMCNNPNVLFKPMNEKYDEIKWSNASSRLKAWEQGRTGFPIVDAGMREMNNTGYMHNRARLIAGSFLPKTLLINWQKGEKYFAKTLTDYDPASNNGNWQWVAGSGSDSQPYFRILNPFLQSKKYDPQASYIKKWIPELEKVPANDIHNWDKKHVDYKDISYLAPIVDYSEQKKKVLEAYSQIFK